MAIQLTTTDHKEMDKCIKFVLNCHSTGQASTEQVASVFAHIITAAAIDNDGEVNSWFKNEQYKAWLEEIRKL